VIKTPLAVLSIGFAYVANSWALDIEPGELYASLYYISADYKRARKICNAQKVHAREFCKLEAKGIAKRARADLLARFEPSAKHIYEAAVVRAETRFEVANAKCSDLPGLAHSACVEEAKRIETLALATALQPKIQLARTIQ
jgi:hypothetical protein